MKQRRAQHGREGCTKSTFEEKTTIVPAAALIQATGDTIRGKKRGTRNMGFERVDREKMASRKGMKPFTVTGKGIILISLGH